MHTGEPLSALVRLAELLDGCGVPWVVGGSTGLALRGANLDREPRDLDVYADREAIPALHAKLSTHAIDGPADNETDIYRSVLSHYEVSGTVVELVGDFRISSSGSTYRTEVELALYPHADDSAVRGASAKLIPLGHELIFNILRDRMDRARVIGNLIAADASRHMPVLLLLIERNRLSDDVARLALRMAQGGNEEGRP
ncbi:nucleotidyltransferase domain-containing protein [Cohnella sp. GCM10027633]|uniref:nucleotidyltransferase domain-containing protein n=1 Tax=unclassified Cohnella TaxID=2636738 RepID=UPI003637EB49